MKTLGFDKPLYILPFDHRGSFVTGKSATFRWERHVGTEASAIGMKTFGASAPLKELQKKFGFEPERLVAVAKNLLGKR